MTDLDVMERVGKYLARAVVHAKPRKENYKSPFVVSMKGTDAVRLMIAARPALGLTRREQIDAALDGWGVERTVWSYSGMNCAVDGCDAPAATKGLCDSHFNRWYKANRRGRATSFAPRPMRREEILREPPPHRWTADCETAWLAGLLEGEGTFSRKRTASGSYPVIAVKMSSEDVVRHAADVLGAAGVHPREPALPAWKRTFVATIAGAEAATWMRRLRPLMGERRRAAIDLALDDYYPERLTVAPEHCVVPGCTEPHRGRGLCHKHYMSWSRDRARGRTPRVKPLRSN